MPDYRRANTPGGTYFFTVNTYQRRTILTESKVRKALRHAIKQARITFPFKVEAWVLLPDHLHCIWTLPDGDANFSARWGMIKRHVSKYGSGHLEREEPTSESRRKRKESALWQRRFWEHQIRDEVDFQRHVDYIHWNPVKHGYVEKVIDWPYSTFHRYVAKGVYPDNWGGMDNEANDGCFGE